MMNTDVKYHTYNKKNIWKGITLTKSAAHQILNFIRLNPDILGIEITIKKSGCAGFTYKMHKMLTLHENIMMYERDGAKLFIPLDVMPFIDGTELDYVKEGLNYSFKFKNPKARYLCGCGESFGIEQ